MNRLAEIRKQKKISQLRLSKFTGISPSDLSRIENYRMLAYPAWKQRIARALNVPEREIFPQEELRQ
jgi:transcriptional regulator with XRE-family HTH domain